MVVLSGREDTDKTLKTGTEENEKGKGAANNGIDREPRRPPEAETVLSRLGKSADGLARGILQSTPTASDFASVSSGKPGPPLNIQAAPLGESSFSTANTVASGSGVFRLGQTDAHVAAAEAAFSNFLDSSPTFVATEPGGPEHAWKAAVAGTSGSRPYGAPVATHTSFAEQQERDGAEVVHLLSQVDEELPKHNADLVVSETELKSLRQAFEDGTTVQISASDWNNMLNFVPDFLRGENGTQRTEAAANGFLNMGISSRTEAGQLWLEQWNRVLTGYADEVWGELGSLVKEAQAEVERMGDCATTPTSPTAAPAIRQLRSVLSRVRARL